MTYSQNSYRGIVTATATGPIGLPVQTIAVRATQDGKWRIAQQTGEPTGGLNNEPGTVQGVSVIGLPYEADEVPKTGAA